MNQATTAGSGFGTALLRAMDQPTREALALSRRPIVFTAAPALVGLALTAAACALATMLDPVILHSGAWGAARADVLRATIEALLVAGPPTLVVATYAGLAVPPRALLAAIALGLLVMGVVAVGLLPLMAYLALVSRTAHGAAVAPGLIVPAAALCGLAAIPSRVVRTLDRSRSARWLMFCFAAALFVTFGVRVSRHALDVVNVFVNTAVRE